MSLHSPPSSSINPRKRDFASLQSNSERQRSRALNQGQDEVRAPVEPEFKQKRVVACPSPSTAPAPAAKAVAASKPTTAPAAPTHEQFALTLSSLYRMSDEDLVAYAGRGIPCSRPIEGTMADCKQKPLNEGEKVLVVISDDSDTRFGTMYQRRAHIVASVEKDQVWLKPVDHKEPYGRISLPLCSDRVQRWTQALSDATIVMNAALTRLRKLVLRNRMVVPTQACSVAVEGSTTSATGQKSASAPRSKPSGSGAEAVCSSLNVALQSQHRNGSGNQVVQAHALMSSLPSAAAAGPRFHSDAEVDAAASLLGYVFEKSPPPHPATSQLTTLDEVAGIVSRSSSTSVSSSEPSFNASESECMIDSSRPPTPVAVRRDHSRSDNDEYGSCEIESFGRNITDALCSSMIHPTPSPPASTLSPAGDSVPPSQSNASNFASMLSDAQASASNPAPSIKEHVQASASNPAPSIKEHVLPSREQLEAFSVIELRSLLRAKGLSTSGSKIDLVMRLVVLDREQLETLTVVELRSICRSQEISTFRQTKQELIDRLMQRAEQDGGQQRDEAIDASAAAAQSNASVSSVSDPIAFNQPLSRDQLEALTIFELRSICKSHCLSTNGSKEKLVFRLLFFHVKCSRISDSRELLNALSAVDLRACCLAQGLPSSGTKENLIGRLMQPAVEDAEEVGIVDDAQSAGVEQDHVDESDDSSGHNSSVLSGAQAVTSSNRLSREQLEALTIIELRSLARAQALSTSGSKNDLVLRLAALDRQQLEALSYVELRLVCRSKEVLTTGTKQELIDRLDGLKQRAEQHDTEQGGEETDDVAAAATQSNAAAISVAELVARNQTVSREQLEALTVVELRSICRSQEISTFRQTKQELIDRLMQRAEQDGGQQRDEAIDAAAATAQSNASASSVSDPIAFNQPLSRDQLEALTYVELRLICRSKEVLTIGTKQELIDRLMQGAEQDGGELQEQQLQTLSVNNLRSMCQERGCMFVTRDKKEDLISKLMLSLGNEAERNLDNDAAAVEHAIDESAVVSESHSTMDASVELLSSDRPCAREELEALTVLEIKSLCKAQGLSQAGLKNDLVFRLLCFLANRARASGNRQQLEVLSVADLRLICRSQEVSNAGAKQVLIDRLMQRAEQDGEEQGDEATDAAVVHQEQELPAGDAAAATQSNAVAISVADLVASSQPLSHEQLEALTVLEIKSLCKAQGLSQAGLKNDLVFRLLCFLANRARASGNRQQLEVLSVADLRLICRSQEVSNAGAKQVLIDRLMQRAEKDGEEQGDEATDAAVVHQEQELPAGDAAAATQSNAAAISVVEAPASVIPVSTNPDHVGSSIAADLRSITSKELKAMSHLDVRIICRSYDVVCLDREPKQTLIQRLMLKKAQIEQTDHTHSNSDDRTKATEADALDIEKASSAKHSSGSTNVDVAVLGPSQTSDVHDSSKPQVHRNIESDEIAGLQVPVSAHVFGKEQETLSALSADSAHSSHSDSQSITIHQLSDSTFPLRREQLEPLSRDALMAIAKARGHLDRREPVAKPLTKMQLMLRLIAPIVVENVGQQVEIAAVQAHRTSPLLGQKRIANDDNDGELLTVANAPLAPHIEVAAHLSPPVSRILQREQEPPGSSDATPMMYSAMLPKSFHHDGIAAVPEESTSNPYASSAASAWQASFRSPAFEHSTSNDIDPSSEASASAFVEGFYPLPFLPPIRRLAKICEHQRPKRLCLLCIGSNAVDEQPTEELRSFSFDTPGDASLGSIHPSLLFSVPDLLRGSDVQQKGKRNRESEQNRLLQSAAVSFEDNTADPAVAAAALLKKQVQAAAHSVVTNRLKPSAPARIVCMALLFDKSRCKLPGIYPDDGELWFCGLHKDKQKFGVVEGSSAKPRHFS